MSIRRARLPFEGQYVQIPNAWMRDERISLRARGLLAQIMTHAEGWEITLGHLWRNATEGREAVRKALLELVDAGYLRRDQERGEHGRFGEINYVLTAPEATVFQKLENGPITGVRSTVFQESAHKEEHLQEEQLKKGGRFAPATPPHPVDNSDAEPSPVCPRHPAGTDLPCARCQQAHRAWTAWAACQGAPTATAAAASSGKAVVHIDGLCDAHRQREDDCEMCHREHVGKWATA